MEYLTPEQVALLLQVHVESVRAWLRAGTLPGVRVGRHWRVRRVDVDQLMKKGGVQSGSGRKEKQAAGSSSAEGKEAAAPDAVVSQAAPKKQVGKRNRKRRY